MNVKIFYDDYLTDDSKQVIKEIQADLVQDVGLVLEVDRSVEENKTCLVKMFDQIGVSEVESKLDKKELRELISLLKQIYNQL